ncbi:PRELI domain-containing protein 1, mitochondrial [Trichinella pseudospiralis]|uniref:PRELI domain-containing protein 1, mitochondrial n=1 Tax=Trichinella pseudospiralis TaxID=6337 RepID=A0A0V1K2J3_TRIPS|nr:PRELI domain-containing protein 1, mitochondrial [Trichinella pseudospiralis]
MKSDFKNTWDEVVSAFWQRYPNPYSSHVLCEDTVFRNVVGNKLITKRIFIKTARIPKWGERFISCKQVPVLEESVVDRDSQKLITYTRNISYARLMSIEEKCIYQADPMNSQCTMLTREAWFKCNLKGFASAIQRLSLERFKHHANNANKGLQFVIAKMLSARQNQLLLYASLVDALRRQARRSEGHGRIRATGHYAELPQSRRRMPPPKEDATARKPWNRPAWATHYNIIKYINCGQQSGILKTKK